MTTRDLITVLVIAVAFAVTVAGVATLLAPPPPVVPPVRVCPAMIPASLHVHGRSARITS